MRHFPQTRILSLQLIYSCNDQEFIIITKDDIYHIWSATIEIPLLNIHSHFKFKYHERQEQHRNRLFDNGLFYGLWFSINLPS